MINKFFTLWVCWISAILGGKIMGDGYLIYGTIILFGSLVLYNTLACELACELWRKNE